MGSAKIFWTSSVLGHMKGVMSRRTLTAAEKTKMARGRKQANTVDRYLKQLERLKTHDKRQASLSPEELEIEAEGLAIALETAEGVQRLQLLQRREDLQRLALEAVPQEDEALVEAFIEVAAVYGERKGISYSTWREVGVPAEVLRRAGIKRTRRPFSPS